MTKSDPSFRILITHIHKKDSYFCEREDYIGLEGVFTRNQCREKGYYAGPFLPDNPHLRKMYFHAISYRRIQK